MMDKNRHISISFEVHVSLTTSKTFEAFLHADTVSKLNKLEMLDAAWDQIEKHVLGWMSFESTIRLLCSSKGETYIRKVNRDQQTRLT